jgi:ribokinase
LEIPIESVLHLADICRDANVPLILDPAPARPLPDELFRKLAWFTPNESEAAFYIHSAGSSPEELAHGLLATGLEAVILKMGAKGSFVSARKFGDTSIQAFPVKAIDTTAAGDAFNGAFATGLMLGKSVIESGVFASAAAAISVTRKGAQPSMPTRNEVEAVLREGSERDKQTNR